MAYGILLAAPLLRAIATPWSPLYMIMFTLAPVRADLLAIRALLALLWRDYREPMMQRSPLIVALAALAAVPFFGPALVLPAWRPTANSMLFDTIAYSADVGQFALVVAAALTSSLSRVGPPSNAVATLSRTDQLHVQSYA